MNIHELILHAHVLYRTFVYNKILFFIELYWQVYAIWNTVKCTEIQTYLRCIRKAIYSIQVACTCMISGSKSGLWFIMIFPDFRTFFNFFLQISLSHQEKKEVACIVSKPLVYCLWGCGKSLNPPKLNIQEVQGLCPLDQRETQACYPFFRMLHCQVTPL